MPDPTRTPQKDPAEGDPGTVERELQRQKPKGDTTGRDKPARAPREKIPEHKASAAGPRESEPPPRDGGGPAPDSPTSRTPDGRRREVERGGIGRSDPSRRDREESRDERPHAPSTASYQGPTRRPAVTARPPDPEAPFC